ncbi:AMP-binding protein [Nocardioides hungaricus]
MTTIPHPEIGLRLFGGRPDDVALRSATESITYAELALRVHRAAVSLGPARSLVKLSMRNDVDSVVGLLGALAAGHPVVLLGAEEAARHDEIARTYGGASELHPDLALLLSTSGTTGSPKLVRLSLDNLVANATSIAEYLALTPDDCAITSLPLHYCYGLSVLTSHLVAGASVALTDLSVADECFWDLAVSARATGFAGVPYTFDLLDASGFADRELPDLRYVTQAGGRMSPDQVVRYARLGAERGWDLFVMYGQTEATARMAYLPPYLAADRPEAIGIPIPGGSFRLAPLDEPEPGQLEIGELVYAGPNVMMGYAVEAADLARGPELGELRTGDLARQAEDGLWEVCGRLDRHAKVFGLRLDLARLESDVRSATGVQVALVAVGDTVHAFLARPRSRRVVQSHLQRSAGLPAGAVAVHEVAEIPTTERGKTDLAALRRQAEAASTLVAERDVAGASADGLRDMYAVVLGRPAATVHDSFVDLGGDSLSFVEVSAQLAGRLGHLPQGWQRLTPVELASRSRAPEDRPRWRRGWTPVEMPVLLRAIAITLIVVSHTDLYIVMGGAHVLLAVAGFNLARFTLATRGRAARSRRIAAVTLAVAAPATLWILVVGRISGDYSAPTALYLNQVLGSPGWSADWQFWFLEVLVWTYLALALVLAVPVVDRIQRRSPFWSAVAAVVATLAIRYAMTGIAADGVDKYTIAVVAWCLAIGWAAAEARSWPQRTVVAVLAILGTWGFFPDDLQRQVLVMAGLCLLLVPWPVLLPRLAALPVQHVAQASFWIYLTHWQVYPEIEAAGHQVLAIAASIAVGLVSYEIQVRGSAAARAVLASYRRRSRSDL